MKTLNLALQTAKHKAVNSQTASRGAQKAKVERIQLLEAAKKRVEELKAQLQAARAELR